MHRPTVALLACLLFTATGLAVLGVAATVTQAPVVVVATETSETADAAATPTEEVLPETEPLVANIPVQLPSGPAILRVARRTLVPGAVLSPERATEHLVLIAETGAIGVRANESGWVGVGLDETQVDLVMRRGEQVVIRPGTVHTVRNAGPMPAVVRVVAIDPVECLPEQRPTFPPRVGRGGPRGSGAGG